MILRFDFELNCCAICIVQSQLMLGWMDRTLLASPMESLPRWEGQASRLNFVGTKLL